MGPTLRDVAEIAGVSPSTVSRVLNGHPQVSVLTREKVQSAVRQVGYQFAKTRSAVAQRNPIALILPDVSSPFYCEVLRGVEEEAFARGFNLALYTTKGRSRENVAQRIVGTDPNPMSGLILVTPRRGEEEVLSHFGHIPPVVVIDHHNEGSGFPHITVDNLKAAYHASRYLLGKGHRCIGMITGPLDIQSARERLQGFRLALEEAGVGFDEKWIRQGDFQESSGYELTRKWMNSENPKPTALFCANDLMAVGALQALRECQVRVPEEMAVMGFDDVTIARLTAPPLTTVAQPIRLMGKIATRLLLRLIDGEPLDADRIVLEAKVVARDSA